MIMLREVVESNPPTTLQAIESLSSRHDVVLPLPYVAFLLKNNGGRPWPPAFPIAGLADNPSGEIQVFFGLGAIRVTEDIDEILHEHRGTVPAGILPTARTDGDDFLCLDLRQLNAPVKFWDRRPFWGNNVWNEDDLYEVASDFEALLSSLHTLDF